MRMDLPREKLAARGAAALSDDELLAILIGFGTKGHPVGKIAPKVREIIDRQNGGLNFEELAAVPFVPRRAVLEGVLLFQECRCGVRIHRLWLHP